MRRALLLLVISCSPAQPTPKPSGHAATTPRVLEGSLEAKTLLGDLPLRAARLGAGPVAIVASGTMIEGERIGAFVEVPSDQCLLAYGRAASSLEDIDLATFAEEGNPLAVDEGPDPRPTVLLCPPHPDRIYVAAHAASGEGLCVVAAQLVPRDRAVDVGNGVNARGALGAVPRTPEAWPGLDDMVRTHRTTIGGAWEESKRVAVSVDARAVSAVAFAVEENGCSDAFVVPDEDVAVVDLDVLDADGRIVARAKDSGPRRSVTVCSPVSMTGSVQVRPHVGRGLVAVVTAKLKKETARDLFAHAEVAWISPSQPLDQTRTARNAVLTKAGYAAASVTRNGQLALGRQATLNVDQTAGSCTRIDVVAGAPLALVEASAWDDAGALLGSAESADGATLFTCGKGRARVDLGARGRPGPYAMLVRPEKWRDSAFTAHPLAAGRMLARASVGPTFVHEGTAGTVKTASLDASHQWTLTTSVPANQCVRIAVGAEGEGTGLELRAVDAASGEELDRSHGQTSAAVHACAAAAAISIRTDLRATAGKLEAVVSERFEKSATK